MRHSFFVERPQPDESCLFKGAHGSRIGKLRISRAAGRCKASKDISGHERLDDFRPQSSSGQTGLSDKEINTITI